MAYCGGITGRGRDLLLLSGDCAEQSKSKYKEGDRVEVQDGFDWKPATVVSVDDFSGWVDARIDKTAGTASRSGKRVVSAEQRAS